MNLNCNNSLKAMALPLLSIVFCAFTTNIHLRPQVPVPVHSTINDTIPAGMSMIKAEDIDSVYITNKVGTIKLKTGDSITMEVEDFKAFINKISPGQYPDYNQVFTKVEVESSYPGGPVAWMHYLNSAFRYPMEAQRRNIEGTVILQFIVDREGKVSNVEAISGPTDGGLREEGIRVVRHSGKWEPAMQNGQKVKSYKKLPIIFRLG